MIPQRLPPRRVGSEAEPFVVELTRDGLAEPITSCIFTLRSCAQHDAAPVVQWGPVAGTVPQAGVMMLLPSAAQVALPAGSYEVSVDATLASGAVWRSPWVRQEFVA